MPMPTRPSHSYRVMASVMRVVSMSPSASGRRLRSGINDTTYHLHFITEDRGRGGHVLAFEMAEGTVSLCTLRDHVVLMPEAALDGVDLSQDLVGAFEAAMAE